MKLLKPLTRTAWLLLPMTAAVLLALALMGDVRTALFAALKMAVTR